MSGVLGPPTDTPGEEITYADVVTLTAWMAAHGSTATDVAYASGPIRSASRDCGRSERVGRPRGRPRGPAGRACSRVVASDAGTVPAGSTFVLNRPMLNQSPPIQGR